MVIDWVKRIETTQVAGIVDRDEDAEPGGRLYVGVRRHLESYLWDPLFVYALLLDENKSDRPNLVEGVDHRYSKSFLQLDKQVLQKIADGMVLIYAEIAGAGCSDLVVVPYVGGVDIKLPQWLIQCDMKRLMESLRKRLGVSWSLLHLSRKYEVLSIVPLELANILIEIQKA